MRVAVAVARFPVVSQTFILDVITPLIDRGHEVSVLALNGPATESWRSRDEQVERYGLLEKTTFGGQAPSTLLGRWARLGRLRASPREVLRGLDPFRLGRDALALKALHDAAPFRGGAYDVIHAQFADIGRRVEHMRALGAVRGAIVTSMRGHDITSARHEHGPRFYRRLARHGDWFLPDCGYFRDLALEAGFPPERTETWSAGLDTGRFPPRAKAPPHDPVRLLAVGRLVEKKGFDDALRALALLGDRRVCLDIVGDGRLRASLEALAAELGIADRVRFLGFRPSPEVRAALEASHLFVAPSRTGPHGLADSTIVTAKEAMAIGLPVVATRHGGIPELVADGESGVLVPERDPAALADALRGLIAHPERWDGMGRAGARIVREHYELSRQIDRLEEIFRRVSASSACTARPS